MIFGTMDSTKSITIELKHDDKLPIENNIHIQVSDRLNEILYRHSFLRIDRFTLYQHLRSTSIKNINISIDSNIIICTSLCSLWSWYNYELHHQSRWVARKETKWNVTESFSMILVAVRSITISTPKSIRDSIVAQTSNILACYHKTCAQTTNAAQLILPNTLKLLPIYVASLIKSDVLIGSKWESLTDEVHSLSMFSPNNHDRRTTMVNASIDVNEH